MAGNLTTEQAIELVRMVDISDDRFDIPIGRERTGTRQVFAMWQDHPSDHLQGFLCRG